MAILRIKFTKMSGAGNDFIVIDNRDKSLTLDESVFSRVLSERRTGVGADGVLILEKSAVANFAMKYYNSDGSYGGFCGNGGRCIARYAHLHGIAPPEMSFESLGHLYTARIVEDKVSLKMKDPKDERLSFEFKIDGMVLKLHSVDTGAPHVVLFLDENSKVGLADLRAVDVVGLGRNIRSRSEFGKGGTNVNFVRINDDRTLSVRTYERGVENETLACGTGSVASALIANRVRGIPSPIKVIPRSNEPLLVRFSLVDLRYSDVYLEGNAKIVFMGELKYDPQAEKLVE